MIQHSQDIEQRLDFELILSIHFVLLLSHEMNKGNFLFTLQMSMSQCLYNFDTGRWQ